MSIVRWNQLSLPFISSHLILCFLTLQLIWFIFSFNFYFNILNSIAQIAFHINQFCYLIQSLWDYTFLITLLLIQTSIVAIFTSPMHQNIDFQTLKHNHQVKPHFHEISIQIASRTTKYFHKTTIIASAPWLSCEHPREKIKPFIHEND